MKGFTDQEKANVRSRLLQCGKDLFGQYGIKKTNIEDLSRCSSIATGSFYTFFASKEELFYEVLMLEYKGNREGFHKAFSYTQKPVLLLEQLMLNSIKALEANPVIERMLIPEEAELVKRKLSPEKIEAMENITVNALAGELKKWQEKGLIIREDPEVLAHLMTGALFYIDLQKSQFRGSVFPKLIHLLVKFIAEGIAVTGNTDKKGNKK